MANVLDAMTQMMVACGGTFGPDLVVRHALANAANSYRSRPETYPLYSRADQQKTVFQNVSLKIRPRRQWKGLAIHGVEKAVAVLWGWYTDGRPQIQ